MYVQLANRRKVRCLSFRVSIHSIQSFVEMLTDIDCTDLSFFALCIMGFSRFWLNMADKEIKVHRRVIRVIFPMIQKATNDRSVRGALPVYDNV